MTMRQHAGLPSFERFPGKASHEPVQFGRDRLFDQLPRSVAQNIGKSVG